MSYARKNLKNVAGSIAAVIIVAAVAVWQFYKFVTFSSAQGGTSHLWWAIAMGGPGLWRRISGVFSFPKA